MIKLKKNIESFFFFYLCNKKCIFSFAKHLRNYNKMMNIFRKLRKTTRKKVVILVYLFFFVFIALLINI
jgi:hypothetical protein